MNLLACVLMFAAAAAEAGDAEVTLLDGTTLSGRIVAWELSQVTIETPEGSRSLKRSELLDVRQRRTTPAESQPPSTSIELTDGSRFPITDFSAADARSVEITTPLADDPVKLPREAVARVDLLPFSDAAAAGWQEVQRHEPTGDVLLVAKRDAQQFDYLTGVVGLVTPEEVGFDWNGQKVDVKRSKVAGIRFFHADSEPPADPACALSLADGSTFQVAGLTLDDEQNLIVETPARARFTIPMSSVLRADYSAGKLAYLSDLEPEQLRWTPRIETPQAASLIAAYGRPRRDASFEGSALSLAWPDESQPTGHEVRTYAKGLALRSRIEATYRVPAGMRRFAAVAGIDPATVRQGHVVLEIRADDRVLLEEEIDGKRTPVEIDLDLGAARRLHVLVDYGRNLDYGDRVHLVEARFTK
jgi:hypothetical protein